MAENDRKMWVKTACSIAATRITISGDADILEVVKAAKKRIYCLEDVSEDMVTVKCNGNGVSKSLKVDSALEQGIGVSDMSEAVLVLDLSEVWVKCEWSSAVTRIIMSPDAKIADVVEAAVKKMKCMSCETEDAITVACRGMELSKNMTVQSALKEGLGLSDKSDEVLVLQAAEVWVRAETCNSATRILMNGGAYIDDVIRVAARKLKDLEDVSEDMISVMCNRQEVRKSLTVSASLQQNLGVSDEDEKVLVLHKLHSSGKSGTGNIRTANCTPLGSASEPSAEESDLSLSSDPEEETPLTANTTSPVPNGNTTQSLLPDVNMENPFPDMFMAPLHAQLFSRAGNGSSNDPQLAKKSPEPKATSPSSAPSAAECTEAKEKPGEEPCMDGNDESVDSTTRSIEFKRMKSPSTSQESQAFRSDRVSQGAPKSSSLKKSPSSPSTESPMTSPSGRFSGSAVHRRMGGPGVGKCCSNKTTKLHKVNSPLSVKTLYRSTISGTAAPNLPSTRELSSRKVSKVSSLEASSLKASKCLHSFGEHRSSKQATSGQCCTDEPCCKEKSDLGALRKVRSLPLGKHLGQVNKATHLQRSTHVTVGDRYDVSCISNDSDEMVGCSEQMVPEKSPGADLAFVSSPSH